MAVAAIPYFVISPSVVACIIGLLRGPDKTIPTPVEVWQKATVDLIIPAHDEQNNIILCLDSISKQTLKPKNIYVVDDGSADNTSEYAKLFAESIHLDNIKFIRKEKSEGKTPALSFAAHDSQADVLFVLDADTVLQSENYIECLVQELHQGVGIASACGVILPRYENDRNKMLKSPKVFNFSTQYPAIRKPLGWWRRLEHNLSSFYREEIYLFLQKFIYHGEMVYCGSLINPVGCAVAYRRKYITDLFDHYHALLGYDLTTSEDIFIGFAFADRGYRNIQVQTVTALTEEPLLSDLPRQILLWSSAFFQSCYYFSDLVATPFKYPRYLIKNHKDKKALKEGKIPEKRKIKEAYRQGFGDEVSHKYGRPIGWFMFTALFEKITFPLIILSMLLLNLWLPLVITIVAEVLLFSILIVLMNKQKRIQNFFKSILVAPIRYAFLMFEIVVMLKFLKDICFSKNRKWKK